jgi:formylmethanofuran dehydrogenase subunit E-like metal-binding protein
MDASPASILSPEGWKKAASGLMGGRIFSVISISLTCAAVALQVIFNTTAGKSSGYSMAMDGKTLAEYFSGKIRPATIAMRVNKKADRCEGVVLGFDWGKAYEMIGVKRGDSGCRQRAPAPPGGHVDQ